MCAFRNGAQLGVGVCKERLGALEELVNRMEAGGMTLADTLKAYESGVKLSESLKKDLTAAQERLIILRGDKPEEGPEEA